MVARVFRIIANLVIKTVMVVVFSLVGWVDLDPADPHHGKRVDWIVAAILGALFTVVCMTVFWWCFRAMVKTKGGSMVLLPAASLALLVAVLGFAPRYVSAPHWVAVFVVGLVLSVTVPASSRKNRQLVAITGPLPPIE